MPFPLRRSNAATLPGVTGTVRTGTSLATLLERSDPGSIVVIEHRDLDAVTAQAILATAPLAVLNAAEFVSGRFASRGARLLAEGGVRLLEGPADAVRELREGQTLRLDGSTLYDGAVVALDVRVVEMDDLDERMEQARFGLAAQLDTFAATTSEFLRREEGLLLHGTGLPEVRTSFTGRPAVVLGASATRADLKPLRTFLREQKPVLIAVDGAAEMLVRRRIRPDLVIASGAVELPERVVSRARELVLIGPADRFIRLAEKFNTPRHLLETGAAAEDVGLLLAQRGKSSVVVPVAAPWGMESFLDRSRSAQASHVLTRIVTVGRVVDAPVLPLLYTGRVRRWQLALLAVLAVAVLATSIALTPVGQDWWQNLRDQLPAGWGSGR